MAAAHESLKRDFEVVEAARAVLQQQFTAQEVSLVHSQKQLEIARNLIGMLQSKLNSANVDNATLHGELQTIETLKAELESTKFVNQWMQRAVYVLAGLVLAVVLKNVQLRQARGDQ